MYLSSLASAQQVREAEKARANRQEVIRALSTGQVTRRDLIRWGIFGAGGMLAWKNGLNPFVSPAYGSIPTGVPASPLFGVKPFTQPMPRCDLMRRYPAGYLNPKPTSESNQTLRNVQPALGGGTGPIEGRPPGVMWAHQKFNEFEPRIEVEVFQQGARDCLDYFPDVPSRLNCGINPADTVKPCFHTAWPNQDLTSMWTFGGTVPPKLLLGRYGEPILFRHHNDLPVDVRDNAGFGRNTISTHEHNGHHGAENDGFTGAYFFPGQFYDYHWPIVHAGITRINTGATEKRCGAPDGTGTATARRTRR